MIDVASKLQTKHQRYTADPAVLTATEPIKGDSFTTQDVDAAWRSGGRRVVDATGKEVRTDRKGSGFFVFRLAWGKGHWTVQEIFLQRIVK